MTSVVAGNAVIGPVLLGRKKGGFNGVVIAVDPAAFGSAEEFAAAVNDLRDAIHGLEPAEGTETVLLPGERGAIANRKRAVDGIPLAAGTAKRLAEVAGRLSVPVPAELA